MPLNGAPTFTDAGLSLACHRTMGLLEGIPLWWNFAIFAVGAVIVWRAGTHLSKTADAISDRTGLGQAFIGALLLGGATSLPEIAATSSASFIGNAPLAVNNVFGGIAMQVAVLAIADAFLGRDSLTARTRQAGVLFEGVLLVLVLVTAATAIAVGDRAVLGVGFWTIAVLALVVLSLYLIQRYESNPQWEPTAEECDPDEDELRLAEERRESMRSISTPKIVLRMGLASLAVLVAGFTIAQAGEQIAEQTGIGGSFVGAALMPVATSLPELSTTLAAVKIGAPVLAISNIFGTNLFDAALLFLIDAVYSGPPVLNEVGRFAQVGALLGVLCTTIYLAGILKRRQRAYMRLGLDSIIVVIVYLAGVFVLYTIR